MHRPYIIHRNGDVTDRTTGEMIATIYESNGDMAGTRGMYWLDLAPGIPEEHDEFHTATVRDAEQADTAVQPDASPVDPYFPGASPQLHFRTQENAAQFAYDYQKSRRARPRTDYTGQVAPEPSKKIIVPVPGGPGHPLAAFYSMIESRNRAKNGEASA